MPIAGTGCVEAARDKRHMRAFCPCARCFWYEGAVGSTEPGGASSRLDAGRRQEFGGREGIEVEHLSPGQLSFANLVQPENRGVELPACLVAASLMPQHHHLILARGNHPRAEPAIGLALEWISCLSPARPSVQRRLQARAAPGVRQGPRPVEFQVIVINLGRELRIALLNRPEHLQDHIDGIHR
jgi:hypothetical protein